MNYFSETLKKYFLIPVVSIESLDKIAPLTQTLQAAGIKFLEITYRNKNASEALKILQNNNFNMIIGAGTIRTLAQAEEAIKYGAKFLVSPGFNKEIIHFAAKRNIPFVPGVDSTLSIELANSEGISLLKFFPAEISGGIKWLKSIKGPYHEIKFIPTGGITLENLDLYVKLTNVAGIGGSFLAPKRLILEDNWDEIALICTKAIKIVELARG
ncbi:bifunctional 4-hydroxy-2-oxoglutarate aldolase/2-dehydro-3-deoxy-phosphogluconate aldolase [Promethearchaeum syntrophicum]|uniref:Bifunctional 4-hydroxy-2-oxoglutarate aldolase/2-dehydro-3-deoxy-phosphogluconate aldolase n=1 Tax=Promethearchaeum syntrophicum TaxID=2594042 RepID=A0A5B9DFB6_9ARCH|nr:bifunctional 4-hydroxy-2-oxoglutarate aldolase/2-dehydro-3-deoxy-phosphogluconate aldolase [Candidatus Prometheoarchaeum syntrophicum]QEE17490.1 keto-hydroxyglutarate-aldolase/keto-deoxy-phosphogluconate aldolase [Candidatus Prometheoarchaeum syntrophicum]